MKNFTKGFTIIEMMLAIAILVLISVAIIPALSSFRDQQLIRNTAEDVVSLLNEASAKTNSSLNSTYYSVHFIATSGTTPASATLFTGGTYTYGASGNKVVKFDSRLKLLSSDISLSGGGVNVTFARLSGDITTYGTITIRLISDSTKSKVITITKTGIVSAN